MRNFLSSIVLIVAFITFMSGFCRAADRELLLFAAVASKIPVEELVKNFEEKNKIKVVPNFGASGMMLAQIEMAKKGDIYFPASSDFMVKAKKRGILLETTEARIVYIVPSIIVRKGNPHKITSVRDLCKPGLKVVLANPESAAIGLLSVELLEAALDTDEIKAFRKNLVTYGENVEKMANLIALNNADAGIGWHTTPNNSPDKIEFVKIAPENIVRAGYLSAAVTACSADAAEAQKFIDYMRSPEGMAVFKKFNYFENSAEAFKFIGAEKIVEPVEYKLSGEWNAQIK